MVWMLKNELCQRLQLASRKTLASINPYLSFCGAQRQLELTAGIEQSVVAVDLLCTRANGF